MNTLWERIRSDYYEEKDYETRRAQKARLAQETGTYKFDLITEKNSAVAAAFAEADAAQAQKRYTKTDALEKAAMAHYAEATMHEALKAAWEQTPGATEAWEFRAAKAEKDQQTGLKTIEGDVSITAARLAAIAQADQQALAAFQREAKEFADIEAAWRSQLKAEEKNSVLKRIAAAKNYLLCDPSAWNALSHPEREAHNEAVSSANELLLDDADRNLQEARGNVWDLRQEAKKVWGVFKSKKSAEQIAQQAKEEWVRVKTADEEEKVGIRWAKLQMQEAFD